MIGMTLKVKGQKVRKDMIGVPGMARLDRQITAIRPLLADKSVVLDIVGLGQRVPADEMMGQDEGRDLPAERSDQNRGHEKRKRKALQNLVVDRPDALAAPSQSLGLVAPSAHEGARQFAQREPVDRLAEA
jgi:hypothetical protein